MKITNKENDNAKDQALIKRIADQYEAPSMSTRARQDFDDALYAKLDRSWFASHRVQVSFAVVMAIFVVGLGWNLRGQDMAAQPPISLKAEIKEIDVEWVATLIGVESETETSDELPEEYASIMWMMDESFED